MNPCPTEKLDAGRGKEEEKRGETRRAEEESEQEGSTATRGRWRVGRENNRDRRGVTRGQRGSRDGGRKRQKYIEM